MDNFSAGIGFHGMLTSVIAGNNLYAIVIIAFFNAFLKSGSLAMERYTGAPNSLIDSIISLFILFLTMKGLFKFFEKTKAKKKGEVNDKKAVTSSD